MWENIKMDICLTKVTVKDCEQIQKMQIIGFKALMDKYNDFHTNPGGETLDKVKKRFSLNKFDQYFISLQKKNIGYIRIQRLDNITFRLSQIFILPEFQGKGYAQLAIKKAESFYPKAQKWELDTIKQETKLCYLYEKMGYKLTGTERKIKEGMDLVDYAK